MHEIVDVSKLQLDRRAHVVVAHDGGEFLDDAQTATDIAPVIVGELEHEELVEDVAIDHGSLSTTGTSMFSSNSSRGRNGAMSSSGAVTIRPSGSRFDETFGANG